MEKKTVKCVVIVTEAAIKSEVLEFILSLGAKGYTTDTVCGRGDRGVRDDDGLLGDYLQSVKIEAVVSVEVAEKIVPAVVEKFFNDYAGIAYMYDVQVLRGKKFHP
jgi:nitrogen regulatory protein PII